MILASVGFIANRHILLAIGDLREIPIDDKSAGLAKNGLLQLPLQLDFAHLRRKDKKRVEFETYSVHCVSDKTNPEN
jgi:hypothetical protein